MFDVEDVELKNMNYEWNQAIKMAAKFQDVCQKFTDLAHQRFFSEQPYSFSRQHAFFRICWQYAQLLKKYGTQVPPLSESKMAAKTQKDLRHCKMLSIIFCTIKLIFMSKCVMLRTENLNIRILSGIKIKMAAKFQDVCPNIAELTHHRFGFANLFYVYAFKSQFEIVPPCRLYNYGIAYFVSWGVWHVEDEQKFDVSFTEWISATFFLSHPSIWRWPQMLSLQLTSSLCSVCSIGIPL